MKPMLPVLKWSLPDTGKWVYEIKYDGYRAILDWTEDGMRLWSRNEKDLLPRFPEIRTFLQTLEGRVKGQLPLRLDGELVLLENPYKAGFGELQRRGRMKAEAAAEQAKMRPAHYLVFDLLMLGGEDMAGKPYLQRKKHWKTYVKRSRCRSPPPRAKRHGFSKSRSPVTHPS